jgi:predicted HicB family RNase H-like nuclease
MAQAQLATRIDERVKKAIEKVCRARGEKMNHFIQEALLDKLEEL